MSAGLSRDAQGVRTMAGTTSKPVDREQRAQVLQPHVLPPTPRQLAGLDEPDRALLSKLLAEPFEHMPHELFEKPSAERSLFGEEPTLPPGATYFESQTAMEVVTEGGDCTLTTAQEILLFQQFNYSRMKVAHLLSEHAERRLSDRALHELLAWTHRFMYTRGQIVQANIPLVLAMAKRTRLNGLDFNELISEGNFALLRSVDKFDCSRGFKFSTYACRAILKSFSRVAMRTSRYRGHFPTEFDPSLEKGDFVDSKRGETESSCVDDLRDILARNRASLNDIEQTVIRERFALDVAAPSGKGKTLEQVGALIGVTKERVRQIQNKALAKIRTILEDNLAA